MNLLKDYPVGSSVGTVIVVLIVLALMYFDNRS